MSEVLHRTRVELKIPADVYDAYDRLAKVEKKPLDQVFSERLTDCVDHNAVHGIWFNDQQRTALETTMSRKVLSADDVVKLVRDALSLKVGPATIQLPADVLDRIKTRCLAPDFDKFMRELVARLVRQYTEGQW